MTDRLIAIDLDNTFADYTTAFADCLAQMGRPVRGGDPTTYDFGCDGWFGEGNGDVFPEFHSRAVISACTCASARTRTRGAPSGR